MVINWGKCTLYVQKLNGSAAAAASGWTQLPIPKEDTTELSTEEGDNLEARQEGGDLVDVVYKSSTYSLAYGLFQKQGTAHFFKPINGVVQGDYAVALVPEDPTTSGLYIGRSSVSANDTFTAAEGGLTTYTHSAKIPEGDENAAVTDDNNQTVYQQMCRKVITVTPDAEGDTYSLAFADEK